MGIIHQQLDEIIHGLSPLGADGMDGTATAAMERIEAVPIKEKYCRDDIFALVAAEVDLALILQCFVLACFLACQRINSKVS